MNWGDEPIVVGPLLAGWVVVSVGGGKVRVQGPNGVEFEFDEDQFWVGFGLLLDLLGIPHP